MEKLPKIYFSCSLLTRFTFTTHKLAALRSNASVIVFKVDPFPRIFIVSFVEAGVLEVGSCFVADGWMVLSSCQSKIVFPGPTSGSPLAPEGDSKFTSAGSTSFASCWVASAGLRLRPIPFFGVKWNLIREDFIF